MPRLHLPANWPRPNDDLPVVGKPYAETEFTPLSEGNSANDLFVAGHGADGLPAVRCTACDTVMPQHSAYIADLSKGLPFTLPHECWQHPEGEACRWCDEIEVPETGYIVAWCEVCHDWALRCMACGEAFDLELVWDDNECEGHIVDHGHQCSTRVEPMALLIEGARIARTLDRTKLAALTKVCLRALALEHTCLGDLDSITDEDPELR